MALQNFIDILTINFTPTAAINAGQPVKIDGTVAGAGEAILGIARYTTDSEDVTIGTVTSVIVMGVVELTASAAIAAGADIEVGATASGLTKFLTKNTGVKAGKALTAAAGNGSKFSALIIAS